MKLAGSRILLTGASGGIGRCLALELSRRGAHLALLARYAPRITAVAQEVRDNGGNAIAVPFDLTRRDGYTELIQDTIVGLGGLDALVNNAGVSSFSSYAAEAPDAIARLIDINVNAPLLLTRAALPLFLQRNSGHIVNIGSIFGSIAFPHFTAYSASKFALRGFSEALRRELCGTGVRVSYIAPRTTATGMNGPAACAFMAETGAAVDPPQAVARLIADAMGGDRAEVFIGASENLFVRLNGLAPRAVDRALAKQNRVADRLLRKSRS